MADPTPKTFTTQAYIATGIVVSACGFSGEIIDVTPPSIERNDIDVSHQQSDGWRNFLPSNLKNPGELKLTVHHTGMYPTFGSTPEVCTVALPNGVTMAFYGYVKSYNVQDAKLDDKVVADLVIKACGEIISYEPETSTTTAA